MNFHGISLRTGWGESLQNLPADAVVAAEGRSIVPLSTPQPPDDRLRRATRECVLAIAAVEHTLLHSARSPADVAGQRTALVYASASSYLAANWAFLHADASSAIYFPYTAPSAVPGEVSMYFNITGPYLSFLSGANAGLEALWYATTLLKNDQCDRALILVVETFIECAELYARSRRLLSRPLVETTLCLLVERHPALAAVRYAAGRGTTGNKESTENIQNMLEPWRGKREMPTIAVCGPTIRTGVLTAQHLQEHWPSTRSPSITVVNRRTGTCLAATSLIGLLLALAEAQHEQILCLSSWGETWSMLCWPCDTL